MPIERGGAAFQNREKPRKRSLRDQEQVGGEKRKGKRLLPMLTERGGSSFAPSEERIAFCFLLRREWGKKSSVARLKIRERKGGGFLTPKGRSIRFSFGKDKKNPLLRGGAEQFGREEALRREWKGTVLQVKEREKHADRKRLSRDRAKIRSLS